jgi:hypothetical protein
MEKKCNEDQATPNYTGKTPTCHNDRRKSYRYFTVVDKRNWGWDGVKITAESFVPL